MPEPAAEAAAFSALEESLEPAEEVDVTLGVGVVCVAPTLAAGVAELVASAAAPSLLEGLDDAVWVDDDVPAAAAPPVLAPASPLALLGVVAVSVVVVSGLVVVVGACAVELAAPPAGVPLPAVFSVAVVDAETTGVVAWRIMPLAGESVTDVTVCPLELR